MVFHFAAAKLNFCRRNYIRQRHCCSCDNGVQQESWSQITVASNVSIRCKFDSIMTTTQGSFPNHCTYNFCNNTMVRNVSFSMRMHAHIHAKPLALLNHSELRLCWLGAWPWWWPHPPLRPDMTVVSRLPHMVTNQSGCTSMDVPFPL